MSKYARLNQERVLSDAMLNERRGGAWFKDINARGPRLRLNGAQTRFIVDGVATGVGRDVVRRFGPITLVATHDAKDCGNRSKAGSRRPCVIHNPSDHGMGGWPLIWDEGTLQMKRLCPHSLEHPDPDDVDYWINNGRKEKADHTCCEECFPGQSGCVVARNGAVHQRPVKEYEFHEWS